MHIKLIKLQILRSEWETHKRDLKNLYIWKILNTAVLLQILLFQISFSMLCQPINLNNKMYSSNEKVLVKRSDCYKKQQQKINKNKVCRNCHVNQPTNHHKQPFLQFISFPLLIPIEDPATIRFYILNAEKKINRNECT